MDKCIELARKTIDEFLLAGRTSDIKSAPIELLKKRAGCFVSLHKKDDGELRGCIGTIVPVCKNLAAEISSNAVSACRDPRFLLVQKDELANLDIQVDVLSEPEPITSQNSLEPKKYGVIVKAADGRTGLLLPDLEGIDDTNYQIAIACQKAGISPNEKIYLYRFTVERHKGQ